MPIISREEQSDGAFVRQRSTFRNCVRADGRDGLPAEYGRYHLYAAKACPWASRALIVRRLKRLENAISVSYAHPLRDDRGWAFPGAPFADDVNDFEFLAEAYTRSDAGYDARVSVPVLWDKQERRIVNNESADIVRMLNSEFDEWGDRSVDLYPADLREQIDALDERIYETVNNGVYRAGFATRQDAYHRAFVDLFVTARRSRGAAGRAALPDRRSHHRGRLAAVRHARALRRRLLLALQAQPAACRRLSEPVGLHARAVPVAGRRGDRRPGPDQGPLLRHPSKPEPDTNNP